MASTGVQLGHCDMGGLVAQDLVKKLAWAFEKQGGEADSSAAR